VKAVRIVEVVVMEVVVMRVKEEVGFVERNTKKDKNKANNF
jgi:hypothetical protein